MIDDVSKLNDFSKVNSDFLREHNLLSSKYDVEFISLKSVKLPLICLYDIIYLLFQNNSIKIKKSDIILLTLASIGIIAKENSETIIALIKVIKKHNTYEYFELVKKTVKSLKNLINIIFKKEGIVITNIEQALKYKHAIDVLNYALTYIQLDKITIKDFCVWYISDNRTKKSQDLIDYININYYIL
jgi:hypothetical protein